jgi:hypothetical protein
MVLYLLVKPKKINILYEQGSLTFVFKDIKIYLECLTVTYSTWVRSGTKFTDICNKLECLFLAILSSLV